MRPINIKGNTESLKKSILDEIEALYDIEIPRDDFLPPELSQKLATLTHRINREIALYIDRRGSIVDISIGDSSTVSLPEIQSRRSKMRLSGIRCIHTHPAGDGMLSSVDLNSLTELRLDAMAAIGVNEGSISGIYVAIPAEPGQTDQSMVQIYGPFTPEDSKMNLLLRMILEIEKNWKIPLEENTSEEERAILVGLDTSHGKLLNKKSEGERSLEELKELSTTAGLKVLEKVLQKKNVKDSAYYIGKGLAEQLSLMRQSLNANVLVFDDELSGAQVRNLEEITGIKVIDRTTLILDIFAQRARSKEGKLQVELAQLKYRLPRLMGMGTQLSRLGGGIGTRGPGEKKLEVDRRHIRRRLNFLEKELESVGKRRDLIREGRRQSSTPSVALVGYTNAGKSTLLNSLCKSSVYAENKLFATLDPTTRGLKLPDGREIMLTDTVGFIRKLPHDLVEAFKSTLEEAVNADILIHVVDVSSGEAEFQVDVVNNILESLGALNKTILLALNKTDLVEDDVRLSISKPDEKTFEISAATGMGLDGLTEGISQALPAQETEISLLVPFEDGRVIPFIYSNGRVLEQEYTEQGIKLRAVVKNSALSGLKGYFQNFSS